MNMINGLEHLPYEEWLTQPEEEKAQEYLICVCKYLVGRNENGGDRIFSGVHNDRKRGIEHKLKYSKSCLNMRKHFFTVKVIKH